jgi:hypothetical protein
MKISEFGDKPKSILEEIKSFTPTHAKEDAINSRANHIIQSAINMFQKLDDIYTEEQALKLKRRFLNSISTGRPEKFSRAVDKLRKDMDGN